MNTEEVARAGYNMMGAAEQMSRAASSICEALDSHHRRQDEFLSRLAAILEEDREARRKK